MQQIHADFEAAGSTVIVISSDNQAATKRTQDQVAADFLLLSDGQKETIMAYNATDPVNPNIALPQWYIIDEQNTILWKQIDVRTNGRLDPGIVLGELQQF